MTTATPPQKQDPQELERDIRREFTRLTLAQLVSPVLFTLCIMYDNLFLYIWFYFAVLPAVDTFFPEDRRNLESREKEQAFERDRRFLIPLYLAVLSDLAIFLFSLHLLKTNPMYSEPGRFALLTLTVGVSGLFMVVVSHELFHRKNPVHKVVGRAILVKIYYMHYFYSHTKIHHKTVATEEDPTSARLGESLNSYFVRNVFGNIKLVW